MVVGRNRQRHPMPRPPRLEGKCLMSATSYTSRLREKLAQYAKPQSLTGVSSAIQHLSATNSSESGVSQKREPSYIDGQPEDEIEALARRAREWAGVTLPDDGTRPPVDSYLEASTPTGTFFRATSEYRAWFDRTYPPTPGDHRRAGKVPVSPPHADGGATKGEATWGALEVPDL